MSRKPSRNRRKRRAREMRASKAVGDGMLRTLKVAMHEPLKAFLTKPSPLLKRLANGDDRGQNPAPLRWP